MPSIQFLILLAVVLLLLSPSSLSPTFLRPCLAQPSPVPYLTSKNFAEKTESKTVFIKFFAPWCTHSKRMEKDWNQLWEEWKDSDIGYVAQVDCTDVSKNGGKALCNWMNIQSFPTLKYGSPIDLDDYDGSTDYEDLSYFAKENLVPMCSPNRLDLCDNIHEKETIERYKNLPEDELKQLIKEEETKLQEAETKFQDTIQELTLQYKAAERDRDTAITAVKKGDLGLMRTVQRAKKYIDKSDSVKSTETNNDEL